MITRIAQIVLASVFCVGFAAAGFLTFATQNQREGVVLMLGCQRVGTTTNPRDRSETASIFLCGSKNVEVVVEAYDDDPTKDDRI